MDKDKQNHNRRSLERNINSHKHSLFRERIKYTLECNELDKNIKFDQWRQSHYSGVALVVVSAISSVPTFGESEDAAPASAMSSSARMMPRARSRRLYGRTRK